LINAKQLLALALTLGFLGGLIGFYTAKSFIKPSKAEMIKDFYNVENAVQVSPYELRKAMDAGDGSFILVDVRTGEDYLKSHIIGAVNIPVYTEQDTSDDKAVSRIVREFGKLPKDVDIIAYCYSSPCMAARRVGQILADHGIYVKHLGIGWNEWRYAWNSWNTESDWNSTKVEDYIANGGEPGAPTVLKGAPIPSACGQGQFGC